MLNKYTSFKIFVAETIVESAKQKGKTNHFVFTKELVDKYNKIWNNITSHKNDIDELFKSLVAQIRSKNLNSCDHRHISQEEYNATKILKFIQAIHNIKNIVVGIGATPHGFYVTDRKLMIHCPYTTGLTSNLWLAPPEKNLANYFNSSSISLSFQEEKMVYSILANNEKIFTGRILPDKNVVDFDRYFFDMFL